MNLPKVKQMTSSQGCKPVANQFTITTNDGVFFQSYESLIAFKPFDHGKILLDNRDWNYSRTTGKYRNEFLGESIADTRKKIEGGEYELTDLN